MRSIVGAVCHGYCGLRGARYSKALLPFVFIDGNLVTGQNPGSAQETAAKVAALL